MDYRVKELAERMDVQLLPLNLIKPAYYSPDLNCVFYSTNFTDKHLAKYIYHELGHASQHLGLGNLYNASVAKHLKMEAEAEKFMITEEFKQYAIDKQPDDINVIMFMDTLNIPNRYEGFVINLIKKHEEKTL